jgi:beta-lactamase regulating signal transducer with metallopeptidase domain
MIPAVLDHLWQSTLVVLAAGLLAMAFRRARASVRFGLWLAASLKFLVPFAALGAVGRLLAPAARPPAGVAPEAALIEHATQPFSQLGAPLEPVHAAAPFGVAAPASGAGRDPALALLALWALGVIVVRVFWARRWAKVRAAVRGSRPLALPAPMPVLASSSMLEPGLVGLWRPVLMVPATLFDHLSGPQIDALVAHEACHLRRRDNLTAAVHMLVEALFWFHPLIWWIGSRLVEERERACDEAVVRSGHDRAAYARSLVECCRLYLQSPLSCVAGASGSDLARRVEAIMTAPAWDRLSRARKTLLLTVGLCALASPVAAGWLTSPEGRQATAHVASFASRAAATAIQDARIVASPAESAAQRPVAPTQDPAQPVDEAPSASSAVPAANQLGAEAPELSLAPVANVQLSKATLVAVNAQTPEATPVAATVVAAPATASPELITHPVWVRLPSMRNIIETSPSAADRQNRPGRASMRCRVDNRGLLSRCVVTAEHPGNLGFGKAAIFLETAFKLRTLDGDDIPVEGRLVDVSIEFTPRFWTRIVGEGGSMDASGTPQVVRWVTDPLFVPYGTARYPWEAMSKGVAAEVTLHCKVLPDGHLSDCDVARETPSGLAFGRQALLAKTGLLRVETRALDGSPMAGRTVEMRYVFNPPCNAMADRNQPPCK